MKTLLLIVCACLAGIIPLNLRAQSSAVVTQQSTADNGKAKPGTYEFMITASKNVTVFTDDVLFQIEQSRDDVEVVYLDLAPGVRVMIPSRKTIEAPGFVPLPEVVYY